MITATAISNRDVSSWLKLMADIEHEPALVVEPIEAPSEQREVIPATQPAQVKFLKFCVSNGTEKARVRYSLDDRSGGRKCVTLYAKDYGHALGRVLPDADYQNDTDSMTDYFEKGRVVLFEGHPLYAAARARAEAVR